MTGANLNSQTQQFDPQDNLPLTKDCTVSGELTGFR